MTNKEFLKLVFVAVFATVATVIVVGGGAFLFLKKNPNVIERFLPASVITSQSDMTIVSAVKKADPAVVAITISKNVPVYEQYFETAPNPFSNLFGGNSILRIPQVRQKGTEKLEVGGGSGFLVSSDGYIVTNRHVVEDTNADYTVFTNDGKKYPAKVISRDEALDLAIIKIEGSDFSHLTFGDSDKLEVGQTVIAIGNALAEFRNTVSVGVVSGLSRTIKASTQRGQNSETLEHLIQTDAAINKGNSGGPLLNLSGEVIGVNVAVANGAENIGFALSSNNVKSFVDTVK